MFHRIKQFLAALTAKLSVKDEKFIQGYLTPTERQLFDAMDLPTQYHCCQVAQTCLRLYQQNPVNLNEEMLIKAALLHDMGKPARSLTTPLRILTVIANYLSPRIGAWLAQPEPKGILSKLRYAFYIQRHHAELGASIGLQHGFPQPLIQLIRDHHQNSAETNWAELNLIKQADNQH